MIGTVYLKNSAINPKIELVDSVVMSGSPSNIRLLDAPRKIGDWELKKIYVQVTFPNNTIKQYECTKTANVWHCVTDSCSTTGSGKYVVIGDTEDESGYVLGEGKYIVIQSGASIISNGTTYNITLKDSVPTTPSQGDVCLISNVLKIYVGEEWKPFANVPTKVSELTNDSNYATVSDVAVRDDALLNRISTKYSMIESELVTQNIYGCFWCTKQDCESGDYTGCGNVPVDAKIAYAYDSETDDDVVWDGKNYGSLTITAQYGNKYKIREPSNDNDIPGKIECILNQVGSTKITIYNLTTGQSAKGLGSVTFHWGDELEVHDGDDTLDSLYPMQNVNFKFPTHMMTLEELINKVIDERINELQ